MTELSLEERVHWNVVEYSKLLKGEASAVEVFLDPAPTNEYVTDDEKDRDLQIGIIWELQQFGFENCTFQHNSQGDNGELTKFGVVTVELPYDIGTFENCTFYNNSHGNPKDAVRNQNNEKNIRDVRQKQLTLCFVTARLRH